MVTFGKCKECNSTLYIKNGRAWCIACDDLSDELIGVNDDE